MASAECDITPWDVKKEVPDDLNESYDIIHVQSSAFVLQDDDVQSVLDNLIRMTSTHGSPF